MKHSEDDKVAMFSVGLCFFFVETMISFNFFVSFNVYEKRCEETSSQKNSGRSGFSLGLSLEVAVHEPMTYIAWNVRKLTKSRAELWRGHKDLKHVERTAGVLAERSWSLFCAG